MVLYVVVAVLCAAALPFSWRRSGGSMTRYVVGTGAPVVLVALFAFALLSAAITVADAGLGREVFTGGLIGSGFTQFILLRHGQGDHPSQGDHLSQGDHPSGDDHLSGRGPGA